MQQELKLCLAPTVGPNRTSAPPPFLGFVPATFVPASRLGFVTVDLFLSHDSREKGSSCDGGLAFVDLHWAETDACC